MIIDNPLVKDTAQATAGEVIHSLQYLALTLPIPKVEDENGNTSVTLTQQEMLGLRNLIECNQSAMESCYYQIGRERKVAQAVDVNDTHLDQK